eukprot:6179967-Pleurochrysis_carterae.AAC.2
MEASETSNNTLCLKSFCLRLPSLTAHYARALADIAKHAFLRVGLWKSIIASRPHDIEIKP